ncbi:MAG: hypothetical protein U9Q07_14765 [Planctomycetota bacterium]|nr:hypothetical protein [Planctomycetota bacterium]
MADDALFFSDAQALPNNTNADSTNTLNLLAANIQNWEAAVAILVDLAFTVGGGKTFTIKVLQSADNSNWDTDFIEYYLPAGAHAKRIAIGLINPKQYVKLNFVDEEDLSSSTITAQLAAVVM